MNDTGLWCACGRLEWLVRSSQRSSHNGDGACSRVWILIYKLAKAGKGPYHGFRHVLYNVSKPEYVSIQHRIKNFYPDVRHVGHCMTKRLRVT